MRRVGLGWACCLHAAIALTGVAACNGLAVTIERGSDAGSAGTGGTYDAGSAAGDVGLAGATGEAACDPRPWSELEIECLRTGTAPRACSITTSVDWMGCRATGCAVCADALDPEYSYYFENHPCCLKNETCVGDFYHCSSLCPAPEPFDRVPKCPEVID